MDPSPDELDEDSASVLCQISSGFDRISIDYAGLRRLDAGAVSRWPLGPDVLDAHVCYQMQTGGCRLDLDGQRVDLNPGEFIWIRPGVRRTLRPDPESGKSSQWYLRFRLAAGLADGRRLLPWLRLPAAQALEGMLGELIERYRVRPGKDDRLRMCAVHGRFASLISEVYERLAQAGSGGGRLSSEQRARLTRFLLPRLAERPTPTELAQVLGLSPRYFTALFRSSYGRSPRSWLIEERIAAAANRLVTTTDGVGRVAEAFGYPDIFLFSRR